MPAVVAEQARVRMTARLFSASSGHPAVNAEVTLFARRAGGLVWSRVDSARTDSAGLVSFRSPMILNSTELMIDWPGDERWTPVQSAPARVIAVPPRF
jgi:5-hydroxyisourate hydrolase-like protein (transthyretin family)